MPTQTIQQAITSRTSVIKPPKQTLGQDVLMRSIKIVDIGFLTIIYISLAIVCAKLTDITFGKFDEEKEKKKTVIQISLELLLTLWLYGVLIYIIRNVVELIPFPLNGVGGFDHQRVKELHNPMVFTLVFLLNSDILKKKIAFYYKLIPG